MKHYYGDPCINQFGTPISNVSVSVKIANAVPGSGAPAIIYSNDGITTKPNPTTTDSFGSFDFYVADGRYDLVFTGASLSPLIQANVEIFDATEKAAADSPIIANLYQIGGTDTALSRGAAGQVNVGTGAAGDNNGAVSTGTVLSGGGGFAFSSAIGTGLFRNAGDGSLQIHLLGINYWSLFANQWRIGANGVLGWSSSTTPESAVLDTGISRLGANAFAFGNGSLFDISALMSAGSLQLSKTQGNVGPPNIIAVTTNTPSTSDNASGALTVSHAISAVSATNDLVERAFAFGTQNSLTGGGHVQNYRNIDLTGGSVVGSFTDNHTAIYIETGSGQNGTITTGIGVRISNLPGTSKIGIQDDVAGSLWKLSSTTGVLQIGGDVGISRGGAAATLALGNNTAGDSSGTLKLAAIQGPGLQKQIFTSSGTFTIPTGITQVKVTVVGGGASGGGANAANTLIGSGGGGGATAIKWLTGLTPSNTLTVTVGASVSGTSGASGTNGNASSVSSGTQTISTITGNGGQQGSTNAGPATGGGGGNSVGGDINIQGGDGGSAEVAGANQIGGNGGASFFGGFRTGTASSGGSTSTPGSGGSGSGNNGAASAGGSGQAGIVIFEWVS